MFLIWLPFLKLLALGAILAVLFEPVNRKLKERIKNPNAASFATILLILLVVLLPVYLVGQTLFSELLGFYNRYKDGSLDIDRDAIVRSLPPQFQAWASRFLSDFSAQVSGFASTAFSSITSIVSNITNFIVGLVLVLFTVYYLLVDWEKIKDFINSIFPISSERENLVAGKLERAIGGVVKGSFLVALLQAIIATVGFLIFGVPQPFLWGAFTLLAALVPTVGTSLSLVPAVLYLLITNHTGAGIGLAIWGATAVGLVDNVVSPKLIGSRTNLHPLLVLFSVIGGLQFFGIIGFLLGPILMAVFVSLLDIYREDLKAFLRR